VPRDEPPQPAGAVTGTRERLLDATLVVVGRDGMRGLTHRRLEDEAGVSRGSARYHLGSHEQIVALALARAAQTETATVTQVLQRLAVGSLAGGSGALPALAVAVVDALAADPAPTRARFELLLEASRTPALQDEARRWRQWFVGLVEQALDAVGAPDAADRAAVIVALLDGLVLESVVTGTQRARLAGIGVEAVVPPGSAEPAAGPRPA
jgi:AcrR family transcriptional regulator